MALDLILMGPPGAGKGTQAARVTAAARPGPHRHRRHAAGRRARRDAARARGQGGHGPRRPGLGRPHHRDVPRAPGRRRHRRRRAPRRLPAHRRAGRGARRDAHRPAPRHRRRDRVRHRRGDRRPAAVRAAHVPGERPRLPHRVQSAGRRGPVRHRRLGALPARRRPARGGAHPVPEAVGRGGGAGDRLLPRPRAGRATSTRPGRRSRCRRRSTPSSTAWRRPS